MLANKMWERHCNFSGRRERERKRVREERESTFLSFLPLSHPLTLCTERWYHNKMYKECTCTYWWQASSGLESISLSLSLVKANETKNTHTQKLGLRKTLKDDCPLLWPRVCLRK
jgi:hypothetical protein